VDYDELTQAVQDYLENGSEALVNNLPMIVRQAEDRIYQSVEILALRRRVTTNCVLGNNLIQLPGDFFSAFSLGLRRNGTDMQYLMNKDDSFLGEAYRSESRLGEPSYYALLDAETAMLAPSPDQAYLLELVYFYRPPSIVEDTRTWLGDRYPALLMWGAIVEAYHFEKGDADLMKFYSDRYESALSQLVNLGEGRNRLDAYRSGQIRRRPTA
jgi:hypothetical protein